MCLANLVLDGGDEATCVFTLVEDVHAWLVSTDGLQDFWVRRKDPDDVPVIVQQLLSCLQLRDACRLH